MPHLGEGGGVVRGSGQGEWSGRGAKELHGIDGLAIFNVHPIRTNSAR